MDYNYYNGDNMNWTVQAFGSPGQDNGFGGNWI